MSLVDLMRDLYLVEQQLRGLQSRLDGAKQRVRVQQIKLADLSERKAGLSDQLKQVKAAEALMETETAAADQRIERLRDQMNNAKTNKEYSALLVEMNTLKVDKGKMEDQALEQLTKAEGLAGDLEALNAQIDNQMKVKQAADAELEERKQEVGDQLEALRVEREEKAARIPEKELGVLNKLLEIFDGDAMAPVQEEDRRRMEYNCGGCYMQIPIERVNLLTNSEGIVTCPSCNRILYLEKELKESLGAK